MFLKQSQHAASKGYQSLRLKHETTSFIQNQADIVVAKDVRYIHISKANLTESYGEKIGRCILPNNID